MQGIRDGEGEERQLDKTTTDAPWTLSPWVKKARGSGLGVGGDEEEETSQSLPLWAIAWEESTREHALSPRSSLQVRLG